MGCSASRSSPPFQFTTTITTTATVDHQQPPTNSSPVSRTMSLPTPLIHHPPLRNGDSDHFVSLTSTTYGSLSSAAVTDTTKTLDDPPVSSPDSVINTWELMEGLDEHEFEFETVNVNSKKLTTESNYVSFGLGGPYELVGYPEIKPLWKHLSEESLLSKLDSNLVSTYNNALSSKHSKQPDSEPGFRLPGCEDRIVLYHTTLRGIRKTYEDCCETRLVLRGFGVFIDERDISMDKTYRTELQSVFNGKGFSLPQVFIRGKHVGGADEVKRLHDEGKLFGLMSGFRVMDTGFVCDKCGDVRFVPCANCNGSRKVFEEGEGRSVRCGECNENGLIRCVSCCS